MFNHGRFNRKRYNLPDKSADIAIRDKWLTPVGGSLRAGEDISLRSVPEAELETSIYLGRGSDAGAGCESLLRAKCEWELRHSLAIVLLSNTESDIKSRDTSAIVLIAGEEIHQSSHIKLNINLKDTFGAKMTGRGRQGADYAMPPFTGSEAINVMATTAQYDTYYGEIDIEVPQGSELIIDSENMTVTLNGENILYAQSGEWPVIDRDVESITISCGRGQTVVVEYQERYL